MCSSPIRKTIQSTRRRACAPTRTSVTGCASAVARGTGVGRRTAAPSRTPARSADATQRATVRSGTGASRRWTAGCAIHSAPVRRCSWLWTTRAVRARTSGRRRWRTAATPSRAPSGPEARARRCTSSTRTTRSMGSAITTRCASPRRSACSTATAVRIRAATSRAAAFPAAPCPMMARSRSSVALAVAPSTYRASGTTSSLEDLDLVAAFEHAGAVLRVATGA